MKKHIALTLLATLFAGCQSNTRPIKTTLDLEATETGLPSLNYSSEKDVIYSRTSENENGVIEIVEFKALASAVAFAQAEREKIAAEASRAQAEALSAAVQALTRDAATVLSSRTLIPATLSP